MTSHSTVYCLKSPRSVILDGLPNALRIFPGCWWSFLAGPAAYPVATPFPTESQRPSGDKSLEAPLARLLKDARLLPLGLLGIALQHGTTWKPHTWPARGYLVKIAG